MEYVTLKKFKTDKLIFGSSIDFSFTKANSHKAMIKWLNILPRVCLRCEFDTG